MEDRCCWLPIAEEATGAAEDAAATFEDEDESVATSPVPTPPPPEFAPDDEDAPSSSYVFPVAESYFTFWGFTTLVESAGTNSHIACLRACM